MPSVESLTASMEIDSRLVIGSWGLRDMSLVASVSVGQLHHLHRSNPHQHKLQRQSHTGNGSPVSW